MTAASTGALILVASLMLSWVALFNNAPLVFSDSISYATAAFQHEGPGLFSVFYSYLILPLHRGVTFWPVVFAQGAMLAHLVYVTTRCVSGGSIGKVRILLIVAGLCVFSGLPWITGQIMPDVFSPVLLLGIFILAFCNDDLSRAELAYFGALTTAAITTHLSHVPIALGLILLCVALRPLLPTCRIPACQWAALLLTPFVVAVCSMVAVNWLSSREIGLARNSNVFLLAKWIDEGPALSYLADACPGAGYALCAHLQELEGLTHDDLKWGADSPFKKVGTFDELEPEARRIVRATLCAYPSEILQRAMVDVGRQLLRFEAADSLSREFAGMVARQLGDIYGTAIERSFIESRQRQGRLPIEEASRLHIVGLVLGLGLCLWSAIARRRLVPPKLMALYVFLFPAIVLNAVTTGVLSGPHNRYLARVIWLVCFVGLIGLCESLRGRRPDDAITGLA